MTSPTFPVLAGDILDRWAPPGISPHALRSGSRLLTAGDCRWAVRDLAGITLALGTPLGPRNAWPEALLSLREEMRRAGRRTVFAGLDRTTALLARERVFGSPM